MNTATFRKTLIIVNSKDKCLHQPNKKKKRLPVGAILFYNNNNNSNNNNNNNNNNNITSIIYTRRSPSIDIKMGQEWIKSTIGDK